jgi:nucleotide-binding universal stress UspA family protein
MLVQIVEPATPVSATAVAGMESPAASEIAVQAAIEEDKRNVARANRYLNRKLREVVAEGLRASRYVMVGHPAESIMEFCKKEKVNLVVMTTHGRTGLKRTLMGSVADKVIRESGHPVLVIRPRRRRDE